MKVTNIFLVVTVVFISHCSNLLKSEIDYSSKYFPLSEGNIWYFDYPEPETNPWAIRKISDSFSKNNKIYYDWTYGEGLDICYKVRADKNGNILILSDDREYLWFDFSQDSGSTYIFEKDENFGENTYQYNVYVNTNRTIEVPAGIFDSCIVLIFDIPQVVDEEISYTFAPGVGIIQIVNDGWSNHQLTKAVIDGNQVGIWE